MEPTEASTIPAHSRVGASGRRRSSRVAAIPRRAISALLDQSESRRDLHSTILSLVSLLSSGMIAALCFTLLTSNRLSFLSSGLVVYTVLIVQWQTFGLTISKMGVEQVVFAAVSRDQSVRFDVKHYLLTRMVPIGLVVSVVIGVVFGVATGVIIFLSILLDAQSLMMTADLSARRRFNVTAIGNMLNYPVFFALLIVLGTTRDVGKMAVLFAFLAGSVARWCWLIWRSRDLHSHRVVTINCGIQMAGQQALNYVLFKSDQLALAILLYFGVVSGTAKFATYFLFLAKFPELVSGVMVMVGTVLFPRLPIDPAAGFRANASEVRRSLPWLLVLAGGVGSAFLVYQLIWANGSRSWLLALPFLLHGLLVFPVNGVTYLMLADGYLRDLLRNLVVSVGVGLLAIAVLTYPSHGKLLVCVVPIQLGVFLTATYLLPLRERRSLYA